MVDLPKGAIIYNHRQTEELLKHGRTSRGKLTGGMSFAKGNAHWDDGQTSGLYGGYVTKDGTGSTLKDTSEAWNEAAENWLDASNEIYDAADSVSDASDGVAESFEEIINWTDVLFNRIENNISEREAYLATLIDNTSSISDKNGVYNTIFEQLIAKRDYSTLASQDYYNRAISAMSGLSEDIQNKIKNGTIDIQEFKFEKSTEGLDENQKKAVEKEREAYEEYVEQIQTAIDYYGQYQTYAQQYWTTISEIADKAVERQEDVANSYQNEIGLTERANNLLEAKNDLLESKEGFASETYYQAQIDNNQIILSQLDAQRTAMQNVLDTEVAAGRVKVGSQQWYDMKNAIYDVDDSIVDTIASIEDLQNSINDLKWDKFDELINRYEYVGDEISNVIQLISHHPDGLLAEDLSDLTSTDWANDNGLATLGLYAQEMERAMYVSQEYAQAIDDLKTDYAAGKYNETEYLSKLNELISAQYDSIEKYYDAKDAIIELNRARVDAIKDGIEKEIDAYDELIRKKKELLDRDKALRDFQDEIAEKEKNVSDIRKQLAAMDGDNTAATTAKKKQLQAQLVEAQKALENSYYDHSMSSRQEALDQEFTDFEDEKNAEIEKWEEWLTQTEEIVYQALEAVKKNTANVYKTLTKLGDDYNVSISSDLTTPWTKGEKAIASYVDHLGPKVAVCQDKVQGVVNGCEKYYNDALDRMDGKLDGSISTNNIKFDGLQSHFTGVLENIETKWQNLTSNVEGYISQQVAAAKKASSEISGLSFGSGVTSGNSSDSTPSGSSITTSLSKGSTVTVKTTATHFTRDAGNGTKMKSFVPGGTYTVYQVSGDEVLIGRDGVYTGWVKKTDLVGYSGGLKKANKDHIALINELGPELQFVPGANGNLETIKYGTSIIPADVSAKLVDMALNPTSMFDGIKTNIKAPVVEAKDFNFEFAFDSLLHVDNANNDSIPALQKMIRSEFNSMLGQVNNRLRRT